MVNKSDIIYNEARNNLRVKEVRNIQWRVNDGDIKGKGQILNISTTGMLLETNSNFIPSDGCRFSFDTSLGHDNFIPQNGKLVWHRKKSFAKNKYLCGIRFVEPGEYVLTKLRKRVQKGIKQIAATRRIRRVANMMVIAGMIGITGYVLWEASMIYQTLVDTNQRMLSVSQQQALLTQSYANRLDATQLELTSVSEELQATNILYSESQNILGDVRVELELTKAVLVDTEELLENTKADLIVSQNNLTTVSNELVNAKDQMANVQDDLLRSQTNLAGVSAGREDLASRIKSIEQMGVNTREEFKATIALLEQKNTQLTEELAKMKQQFTMLSSKGVKSTEEGQKLLQQYKLEVGEVKTKLKHYRQEAKKIREEALIERDRIRMTLGNQGYFMRDGETVKVDPQEYKNAGLEKQNKAKEVKSVAANKQPEKIIKEKPSNRQVEIDVTFVE